MTFQEVIQRQVELESRRNFFTETHEREVRAIDEELTALDRVRDVAAAGFNVAKADLALRTIYVRGRCRGRARRATVYDAMEDLALNQRGLRCHSLKVKAVAGFIDRQDNYPYTYAPDDVLTWDDIRRRPLLWLRVAFNVRLLPPVFEVGLLPEARGRDLTPDEVEAALYYLEQVAAGTVG